MITYLTGILLMCLSVVPSSGGDLQDQVSENELPAVIFHTDKDELMIGSLSMSSGFTKADIEALLGPPPRITGHAEGQRSLFYDGQGIVATFNAGRCIGLGISLADDGNERFARGVFEGTLRVGGTPIIKSTEQEQLEKLRQPEFECPVPTVCACGRSGDIQCLVMYNQEGSGEVAQVVFSLNNL